MQKKERKSTDDFFRYIYIIQSPDFADSLLIKNLQKKN
jgi:hypothetical protein